MARGDRTKPGKHKSPRPGGPGGKGSAGPRRGDGRPAASRPQKRETVVPEHREERRSGRHARGGEARASRFAIRGEMLFGQHAVRAAFLNESRDIHALYATEAALAAFEDTLSEARDAGLERPSPVLADKDALDRQLAGAVHQGLLLDAAPLPEVSIQDLIASTSGRERVVFAVLDQVTDPHNVGAILRSACAFGVDGIVMQRRNAPDLSGVLAKTACGATEHLPVAYETNLSRTLEVCKEAGFVVIGLDEHSERGIGELDVSERTVIVLGAEGPGMRRLVREHCDMLVTLPTRGAIRSLNVSNAAAIVFFALAKR